VTCSSRSTSATTTPPSRVDLGALRERAGAAGILLDFDGTLAEIVARPELARPAEGVRRVLGELAQRYRLVAIITGRRSEEAAALLDVPSAAVFGLYGFEGEATELVAPVVPRAQAAARVVPEAWVEDKGASIAVHYRQAPDPSSAREALVVALRPVATEVGLELVQGKMVVELIPWGRPMKGEAVERLVGEHDLEAVLYAGDDQADIEAFRALDRSARRGLATIRVAVRGDETPAPLLQAADVVVEGPAGLVELLRELAI
jgi:trehalose 6-phosphate phosphatase